MDQSIISVGIDIGTSTTQLVFSRIVIKNTAAAWTVPTIKIVGKEIIYKSKVHFTPLINEVLIDGKGVRQLIEEEYRLAGIAVDMVDTGAVIITGETARKENAEEVLLMLSGLAGDFVVATAGPEMEGIIAGKGSGASQLSKDHGCTIVNYDIGGGTTNIAVFKNGDVIETACLDVGGRLIKIDDNQRITYLSQKMTKLSHVAGLNLKVGQRVDHQDLSAVVDIMAEVLLEVINHKPATKHLSVLITDHGLSEHIVVNDVCFSGGVADCIENESGDVFKFGDIGILLGRSIKKKFQNEKLSVRSGIETIRATVVGAGLHTTDVSGSTVTFDETVLPLKDVPIVRLSVEEENQVGRARIQSIEHKLNWFDAYYDKPCVALSIRGSMQHGFSDILELADDIVNGMTRFTDLKVPLIVLIDCDNAKVLGRTLREKVDVEQPVICLDSVFVGNGDYIDIGRPVVGGQVVPVIIKTLLFDY